MRELQRKKKILAGLGKAEKAAKRRKYKCIVPECNEDSIKSHSQQKKHQLESISEDSQVVAMKKSLYDVFNRDVNELLKELPIGEVSRFSGYCNQHDTSIFSPIENGNIDIQKAEHNFLLLLRAISHEYATKRGMYDRQKDILFKIGEYFSYEGRRNYEASLAGVKYYVEKDAPYYLSRVFRILESKKWSEISFNSFVIERNLGVSSTTCFSPFRENHSEWMRENFDKVQPFLSFSLLPESNRTTIAFVWLSEFDDHCNEFKEICKDQENILNILNTYALCESEDVCIKPSVWGKLSKNQRSEIYRHMGGRDSLPGAEHIPLVLE